MRRAKISGLPTGVGVNRTVNGRRRKFWRVRLGKRFTGGRVMKKDFSTLASAREWIFGEGESLRSSPGSIVGLKRTAGSAAFQLTSGQLSEAAAAVKTLGASGTITEAVAFFLKHARPIGGEKLIGDAISELLVSKRSASRSERHLRALGWNLRRFAANFPNENLHEIHRDQIERWLGKEEFAPRTRANYLRDLTILFRFGISREWLVATPTALIEKAKVAHEEIMVPTVEETSLLLATTERISPQLAVPLAIKFFAGLRTSELFHARWSDIRDGQIIVKGGHAKTRQRRAVHVSENLAEWLTKYASASGPITMLRNNAWHRALEKIVEAVRRLDDKAAPNFCLSSNAARHSFCSYHFALHRNENLTAAEAGNSPAVVFRNYRALVTRVDAKRYWNIRPSE